MAVGAALLSSAAAAATTPACDPAAAETTAVIAVHADWSIGLSDGRSVRLAGIDPVEATPAHPDRGEEARARLASWLVGHTARLLPLSAGLDRWGRQEGLLFAAGPSPDAASMPLSVALALVDAGLARGRPDPRSAPCWPALVAAEAAARIARLGLWDDPAYAVLRPGDEAALEGALGTMVLVEGRVARIGRGRTRVFIQLGTGDGDVTLSIAARDLFILDQVGLNGARLVGESLRARGVLENRSGFSVDVTDAEQLERLDGRAAGAPVPETGGAPSSASP